MRAIESLRFAFEKLKVRVWYFGLGRFPRFVSFLKTCGITGVVRNYHYRSGVSPDGVYRTRISDVGVAFHVPTAGDLVQLEHGLFLDEQKSLDMLLAELHAGDAFLDVGASVGIFTLPSATVVGESGQVIAFEPGGKRFRELGNNLFLNGLRNVRAFNVALGENEDTARLRTTGHAPAILAAGKTAAGAGDGEELVDVVCGDSFWRNQKLPIPRVVKIDVDGFEYAVLKGLRGTLSNPACELLFCEIHPDMLPKEATPEAVETLVSSLGFEIENTFQRRFERQLVARKKPLPSA